MILTYHVVSGSLKPLGDVRSNESRTTTDANATVLSLGKLKGHGHFCEKRAKILRKLIWRL